MVTSVMRMKEVLGQHGSAGGGLGAPSPSSGPPLLLRQLGAQLSKPWGGGGAGGLYFPQPVYCMA